MTNERLKKSVLASVDTSSSIGRLGVGVDTIVVHAGARDSHSHRRFATSLILRAGLLGRGCWGAAGDGGGPRRRGWWWN